MNAPLIRYYDWAELAARFIATNPNNGVGDDYYQTWYGADLQQTLDFLTFGDADVAARAEAFFDEAVDVTLPDTEGGTGERVSSPVGSFPNVANFLAGRPDSMYRHTESPVKGPVRIYLNQATYSACSPETILQRGIATTAVAYALQLTRPVEIFLVSSMHLSEVCRDAIMVVPVGIAPLDLSRVAAAVGRIAIPRRLYKVAVADAGLKESGIPIEKGHVPTMLGLGADDVYLPAIDTWSQEAAVKADPLAWVRANMKSVLAQA